MRFFDANCMLGRSGFTIEHGLNGTAAVLAEAVRNGIADVLAYHAISREWDPLRGNALMRRIMDTDDRVLGCWVVEPLDAYRPGAASKQIDTLVRQGFSSARLFPDVGAHNYELSGRGVRALLAASAERQVPVFLETETPDWSVIDSLLGLDPELPLILTGISYRRSRNLYALLDAHPRLHVESATFVPHLGVEDVVGRFGVGRVLFGTKLPTYSAGAAVARIRLAALSETDKARIAGDTLRSLIMGIRR